MGLTSAVDESLVWALVSEAHERDMDAHDVASSLIVLRGHLVPVASDMGSHFEAALTSHSYATVRKSLGWV